MLFPGLSGRLLFIEKEERRLCCRKPLPRLTHAAPSCLTLLEEEEGEEEGVFKGSAANAEDSEHDRAMLV